MRVHTSPPGKGVHPPIQDQQDSIADEALLASSPYDSCSTSRSSSGILSGSSKTSGRRSSRSSSGSSLLMCTETDVEPGDGYPAADRAAEGPSSDGFTAGYCGEAAAAAAAPAIFGPTAGAASLSWSRPDAAVNVGETTTSICLKCAANSSDVLVGTHDDHHRLAATASGPAGPMDYLRSSGERGPMCQACQAASPPRLPAQHRALIVGWMRQVSSALTLHPATLFSAVSLLDRFVATWQAPPADGLLQLLALTCMSVAVKYNEASPLHISPAVWLGLAVDPSGSNLYQARDLQRCEFSLLQAVDWRLHEPNTFTFLEQFLVCLRDEHQQQQQQQVGPAALQSGIGSAGYVVHGGDIAAAAAAASGIHKHNCCRRQGHNGSANPWESDAAAAAALALAETSLIYDTFLSYDYSTTALACVSLAMRPPMTASAAAQAAQAVASAACGLVPHLHMSAPPDAAAAAGVATSGADAGPAVAARLPLRHPMATVPLGLASCMEALKGYCCFRPY